VRKRTPSPLQAIDLMQVISVDRMPIKFQFGLFLVLFSVLLVSAIGYFVIKEEKQELTRQRIYLGEILASNLASGSRDGIIMDDELLIFEMIDGILKKDTKNDIAYVFITDPAGKIIAHNKSELMGTVFSDAITNFACALNQPAWQQTEVNGATVLDFSNPIFEKVTKKKIGVARIGLSYQSITRTVESAVSKILTIFISALVLGIIASIIWVRLVTRPISDLAKGAEIIGAGDLTYRFTVKSKNEIGELAEIFNKMTIDLAAAQDELIAKRQLEHEIELARAIQATLLPKTIPETPTVRIAAFYQSAMEVGGDYYDFIEVDDTHLGVLVADVSGKGIAGAFIMGITRAIFRIMASGNHSPAQVLSRVNGALGLHMKKGMFVTMLYCIINTKDRRMRVASAGHDPLLYLKPGECSVKGVNPDGFAIGIRAGREFDTRIKEENLVLGPGDFLALTTDGVTEAMNAGGEEFGEQRLFDFMVKNAEKETAIFRDGLVNAIREFTGDMDQSDDITMVVIKIA